METSTRAVVIITGATAGIGLATARQFARAGFRVVGTGRRADRLQELAHELGEEHFRGLQFDIRQAAEVEAALTSLPDDWRTSTQVLVNNAGLARGLAPLDQGNLQDWEEMIDTNVKGLLYVSRVVAAWMRAQHRGTIINIGSTAGREVYPNGNVYCATKFAVDALTRGLRMDLMGSGVRVSAVNPGYVETEFSQIRFNGDEARAKRVYEGFRPLYAEDIAEVIYWVATTPKHMNLADVLVMPTAQASAAMVHREAQT